MRAFLNGAKSELSYYDLQPLEQFKNSIMLSNHQAFYMFVLLKCTLTHASDNCIVSGVYNPVATRQKLNTCATVTFRELTVLAGVQLDLNNLREGITLNFTGKIVFKCKV